MSQIATTIAQSRRLIEAGVKPSSCDMGWSRVDVFSREKGKFDGKWVLIADPCKYQGADMFPAWSLSRLIDIIGNFNYGPMDNGSAAVIDCAVNAIIYDIQYGSGRVKEKYLKRGAI